MTAINAQNNSEVTATAPQTDVVPDCAPQEHESDVRGTAERPSAPQSENESAIGEYVAFSVKILAVVLSLIVMFACILAIGMPLSSMRIFNKLGMSERAIDFGERYISNRLDDYGANGTDDIGNFDIVAKTPALTDDDMIEALYVCNDLSYRLMEEYYGSGDAERGKYYAERLEKYTRLYMSLNGIAAINERKSTLNMDAMPTIYLRPMVYNYAHSIRLMNFRARTYLGKTDAMLYDSRSEGDVVATLAERTNTFNNERPLDELKRNALMTALDDYVDYVGQIAEYLTVEFKRAGVNTDPFAKVWIKIGDSEYESIYMSETTVQALYTNKLKGNEFSLLLSRGDENTEAGFTYVYNVLKKFPQYVQAAVNFVPSGDVNIRDEQLHQLYWLQTFSTVSSKLWYMSQLLNYSKQNFGTCSNAIDIEYGDSTCEKYTWTKYEGSSKQIWGVYTILQNKYFTNN